MSCKGAPVVDEELEQAMDSQSAAEEQQGGCGAINGGHPIYVTCLRATHTSMGTLFLPEHKQGITWPGLDLSYSRSSWISSMLTASLPLPQRGMVKGTSCTYSLRER